MNWQDVREGMLVRLMLRDGQFSDATADEWAGLVCRVIEPPHDPEGLVRLRPLDDRPDAAHLASRGNKDARTMFFWDVTKVESWDVSTDEIEAAIASIKAVGR